MVHRKSEYKLNYKWLPSQLCKDVRLSTADFRVERKKSDLAHFWSWDLSNNDGDRCDCEVEDEAERYLPVPRMKQKHDHLLEQWQKKQLTSPARCYMPLSPYKPSTPAGVLQADDPRLEEPGRHSATHTPTWVLEDAARQAPTARDPLPIGDFNEPRPTRRSLDTFVDPPRRFSTTFRDPPLERNYNIGTPGVTTSYAVPEPIFHRVQSAGASRRPILRSCLQPAIRPSSAVAFNCGNTQNRTRARNADPQNGRPPFVSYGWNDNRKTIGDRRTYNVKASKPREVYPSAIKAYRRKEADVKRQIVAEQQRNLLSKYETFRCPGHPVNPSSIWMTEYRRNYNNTSRG